MTSASTLARQARAEKNPKKRKALLARAAKMRRDERAAKKNGIEKTMKGLVAAQLQADKTRMLAHQMDHAIKTGQHSGIVAGLDPRFMHPDEPANNARAGEQPGRGEIVGGALAMTAETMAKLARKKGGVDTIQQMLAQMESQARYEGTREAEHRFSKERITVREAMRDKIVCGFIAEVETVQKAKNGIPPSQTWLVNAFTVVNLIDALNAAGYTAHGKR